MTSLIRSNRLLQAFGAWVGACWGWDLASVVVQSLHFEGQTQAFSGLGWMVAVAMAIVFWKGLESSLEGREELPSIKDLLWFLPLVGFFLFKLPFPDLFYDTTNYHIILQNPISWEFLSQSFFPAGMGTFVWPLADHVFLLPRNILGYRLGTVVNLGVAWLCFLEILSWIGNRKPKAGAFALACLSTEVILVELGSYYVDLLPIPFLLMLFRDSFEPNRPGSLRRAVVCSAIAVSLKMASFPMILVAFGFWVTRAKLKTLKWAMPAFSLLSILFLLSPYMVTAGVFTGNPIFPVMNKVFQSPLFPLISFRDERWGPRGIVEFLLFPILAIFKKARLYEGAVYGGRLAFYFVPLVVIYRAAFQKINKRKTEFDLSVTILAMLVLWELSTGYIRYAFIIEILMGILVAWRYFDLKDTAQSKITANALVLLLILQCSGSWIMAVRRSVRDFIRPDTASFISDYLSNLKWVGRDQPLSLAENRALPGLKDQLSQIQGWITDQPNAGIVALLGPEIPLIQLSLWSTQALEDLKREKIRTLSQKGLFAYTFEPGLSVPAPPPLQDKLANLGIVYEDAGFIGPISFLPSWAPFIHIYRVHEGTGSPPLGSQATP